MSYVVIIPTDNPDVGAAYQAIDYAAAEALAAELVREHGRQAIIAQPIAATQTRVSVARLVAEAEPPAIDADAPSGSPWEWVAERSEWRTIVGTHRYIVRREGRQWVGYLGDICRGDHEVHDGRHNHVDKAKAACVANEYRHGR